jgi:hypothetical protein
MEKKGIFDNPRNLKILLAALYILCFVSFAAELLIHKHTYFDWEKWPLFYGSYGFISCVMLVLVAKYIVRPLIMRDEDFYDR